MIIPADTLTQGHLRAHGYRIRPRVRPVRLPRLLEGVLELRESLLGHVLSSRPERDVLRLAVDVVLRLVDALLLALPLAVSSEHARHDHGPSSPSGLIGLVVPASRMYA